MVRRLAGLRHISPASAAFNDMTGGVGYYQFLEDVSRRFAEDVSGRGQLIARLKDVRPPVYIG